MTRYFYIEPTDSLFVRGNLAFGASGEHGSAAMPPPPSLFAGALRSAVLGADAAALARFQQLGATGDAALDACLGTFDPASGEQLTPGTFVLDWLSLAALQTHDGQLIALRAPPADLIYLRPGLVAHDDGFFAPLRPRIASGLEMAGGALPLQPGLCSASSAKPAGGRYLTTAGWARHLDGKVPDTGTESIASQRLHRPDPRLGIGLDSGSGTASDGHIYTTEGHAFSPPGDHGGAAYASTGFLVGVEGGDGLFAACGTLRLGGDGRSARYREVSFTRPLIEAEAIGETGRFRLVLTTAGLFEQGWLPDGVRAEGDAFWLRGPGFEARLACAALPRAEVVSGWDLLRWAPKPAERSVPAGAVYWFDLFNGDPAQLAAWAGGGLNKLALSPTRRAEGYNRAQLAIWNPPQGAPGAD